ncbi:hypothetical protein CSA56_08990 [candidate division KSB3 bacterium]|uniref:DUF434 domain-containing protein n=1 Tax=candidate division KSB3 bacterium TaxID=2044937 RepID=A0A2G6KGB6_9BACT|nr:MAG: hypothetical protein CSA56_08990 [candidate division KSB3 bacterium]
MPDTRCHRGAHPSDEQLFNAKQLLKLRVATDDLSWLLSRGYSKPSALKLVGDRHQLHGRQRMALGRSACSDQAVKARKATCLPVDCIRGKDLLIDGFNLLITIEAALAGGLLLLCRDGCVRDLASVHGSYRSVEETTQAILLIGNTLEMHQPQSVEWLFDKPVSNSGKITGLLRTTAESHDWPWTAQVVFNPDTEISHSPKIAISSDSSILDHAARWVNFSRALLEHSVPRAWMINLQEKHVGSSI